MDVTLPRTDGVIVRAIAHRMGVELRYAPTNETVQTLLRMALDQALAGAATARNQAERKRWNREIVRCRLVLSMGGHN